MTYLHSVETVLGVVTLVVSPGWGSSLGMLGRTVSVASSWPCDHND